MELQIVPPVSAQGVPLKLWGMPPELLYVPLELQVSVLLELVGVPLEIKCVPPGDAGSTGAKGRTPGAGVYAPEAAGCAALAA